MRQNDDIELVDLQRMHSSWNRGINPSKDTPTHPQVMSFLMDFIFSLFWFWFWFLCVRSSGSPATAYLLFSFYTSKVFFVSRILLRSHRLFCACPRTTTIMKITSILLIALAVPGEGFQFMSKWKMPTHDPNQEKIQEKFGNKSKC